MASCEGLQCPYFISSTEHCIFKRCLYQEAQETETEETDPSEVSLIPLPAEWIPCGGTVQVYAEPLQRCVIVGFRLVQPELLLVRDIRIGRMSLLSSILPVPGIAIERMKFAMKAEAGQMLTARIENTSAANVMLGAWFECVPIKDCPTQDCDA